MAEAEGLRLVRTNRLVRSAAFAYCLLPIGLYLLEEGAGAAAWSAALLLFGVYPQLVYWRAARSASPARAELDNLLLDAALLGAWSSYLGFPRWIAFSLIAAAMLNAAVNRGMKGVLLSLACSAAGAVLVMLIAGFRFQPEMSALLAVLCINGLLVYIAAVGCVVYRQNRRLAAARDALAGSERRYRLIAENADDLVALLDLEGRWLYASPSYEKVVAAAELAPGADAFRRLHPDDAEQAKAAVLRAQASGKPREMQWRMVDREGRIRQYQVRLQPVGERVVVVSRDVTDLRESEERVLLAAHALEGMTDAIMITSADGTIVTVNRAFCEITGHRRDEVLGLSEKAVRSGMQPPEFYDEVYAAVHRDGYWSGTAWKRRKNGVVYREWRSVRAVRQESDGRTGAVSHYVHVFYEVGAPSRREAERA
ncbi:MAG TPA: PAS domain S-box protein [Burkholderiales bacterium]|nr:PAS domain S-box protein [Burkholderiales bacterium]